MKTSKLVVEDRKSTVSLSAMYGMGGLVSGCSE